MTKARALSIWVYFNPVFLFCLYEEVVLSFELLTLELCDALAKPVKIWTDPPNAECVANSKADEKKHNVVKNDIHSLLIIFLFAVSLEV
jgi:hypothetical protein